jgi:hypothetical protein
MMQVQRIYDDFWQVSNGDKWWTVKSENGYGLRYWIITNSRGRILDSTGPVAQRILRAIRKAEEPADPADPADPVSDQ